jgi:hypothetical protein
MGVTVIYGMLGVTLFGLFPSLRYASKTLRHTANNVRRFGRRSSDLGVAELTRYARVSRQERYEMV